VPVVWYGIVGFNVPLGDHFMGHMTHQILWVVCGSYDPNNSVILKDNG